ncbi:ERCC4 domain-containing protein [Tissierella pigra]|uniref:ERCC4 domain-containing protein n=1 Tax=Tissierella pigra TaxID=2607614 RepID=A0A6N7XME2_9FIRM|nr:ERCC4 domain-containing protein [Tissierella pigra]MSU01952.1 hypothetical protein [Tissierella pigra]
MIRQYRYTEKELNELLKSITIVVDTRENANDHIIKYFDDKKIPHVSRKLDYGDYSCFLPANPELGIMRDTYFDCVIERKAHLEEVSGNFTTDRTRIENEFIRAKDSRFIMMIEKKENKEALLAFKKIKKVIDELPHDTGIKTNDFNILKDAIAGIGSFEDIIEHKYDTQYNEKSFIASLFTFGHRHDIDIHSIDKKYAGLFIYHQLYYFVREYLR